MSELGRNREAMQAFQAVLEVSPYNSIAKKNLSRLGRLSGDDAPRAARRATKSSHTFIEESGKAGVTSLLNLASPEVLLKLTPGDLVETEVSGNGLTVVDQSGEYIGKVEPRMATRLSRLIRGGNKYEATVTSTQQPELAIIIREVYAHPSQAGIGILPFPKWHRLSRLLTGHGAWKRDGWGGRGATSGVQGLVRRRYRAGR